MKHNYTFVIALIMSVQTFAQVSVGNGTETDYDIGPVNAYYTYSYYQTIYRATEIGAKGEITALEYEMSNENPIDNTDDEIDIWMGHTEKSIFDKESDWIGINTLNKVLTNGKLVKEGRTIKITLDEPFNYNGVDNLVIAIDANEAGYNSSSDRFYCTRMKDDERVNLYYRNDNVNPDPANTSSLTEALTNYFYPNIVFHGINQSCPKPSNLLAKNMTGTTVDLSWTEVGSATNWTIEYGSAGFVQGTGTTVEVDSNPFVLTGLKPVTKYEFYVKSNCSADENSPYIGPVSFSTECATISTDFEVDFSIYPPSCWQIANGPIGGDLSFGASRWRDNRSFTNEKNEVISSNAVNLWGNKVKTWLISNNVDLSAGNFSLEALVAVTNYTFSGTSEQTDTDEMGEDDSVYLLISNDNGTTWTDLAEWNEANQPLVTGTRVNVDLSDYRGVVKFALYATDGNLDDNKDYDFHVGKFKLTSSEDNLANSDVTTKEPKFEFYPNPVNDILIIKGKLKIGRVNIYDATGKLLYQNIFSRDTANVNVMNLDKGFYTVIADIDGVSQSFKIIKK
ncbi:T9SS type A sorting domain-containing protein [Flavobacteriaceae bacterium Ap0902]|nr:T9SS type A sorting domain-containing protein [Flavobacteriaceae bacterium Ap0902]